MSFGSATDVEISLHQPDRLGVVEYASRTEQLLERRSWRLVGADVRLRDRILSVREPAPRKSLTRRGDVITSRVVRRARPLPEPDAAVVRLSGQDRFREAPSRLSGESERSSAAALIGVVESCRSACGRMLRRSDCQARSSTSTGSSSGFCSSRRLLDHSGNRVSRQPAVRDVAACVAEDVLVRSRSARRVSGPESLLPDDGRDEVLWTEHLVQQSTQIARPRCRRSRRR